MIVNIPNRYLVVLYVEFLQEMWAKEFNLLKVSPLVH